MAESAFASCLARHNTYLSEETGHRDIGYPSTVQDIKLLLLRFAQDKSFSDVTGGGGPQSNIPLLPYLMHMALYVLNTTRSTPKEERNLNAFLAQTKEKILESAYVVEGPFYYAVIALLTVSPKRWRQEIRVKLLQRLVLASHCREVREQTLRKIL